TGLGGLLVAWMLTPDDGGQDGGFRSYLRESECWKRYDPELYDGLVSLLESATTPAVSLIERSSLLPNTRYYSALLPDQREGRDTWRRGLLDAAREVEWVFLDPDNGIEVPSKSVGRKGSSKYVTWDEIDGVWNAGCSVLLYQHFPRKPRQAFAECLADKLRCHTGAGFVEALRTPRVLFLLAAAAAALTEARREVSTNLEKAVEQALAELGMKDARFEVRFEPEDPPGPRGAERVEFMFSPNPGEPPKPLSRIASGGEMSRVMLALKAILAEADEIPTLIFDEIDSGVGGGAAQAVGEKLATIALRRQVVCVTHLARIASLADAHHFIHKETAHGRTETKVATLEPDGRVEETARMLAGHPPTPITLAHAREMLQQGQEVKSNLRASRLEAAATRSHSPA
ncbi:MAG: hypothetical protein K6U08_10295, partial [Firmicutes bacterium]|nr:hypothetical protein [Bacillota bacterium]